MQRQPGKQLCLIKGKRHTIPNVLFPHCSSLDNLLPRHQRKDKGIQKRKGTPYTFTDSETLASYVWAGGDKGIILLSNSGLELIETKALKCWMKLIQHLEKSQDQTDILTNIFVSQKVKKSRIKHSKGHLIGK